MLTRFRNAPLRKKMLGVFSGIFLLAIFLIVTTSTVIAWKLSEDNANHHSSVMLRELQGDFEYIMQDVENISRFTIYEDRVQKYLQSPDIPTERNAAMLAVKDTLVNVIVNKNYIESVSIYFYDGTGMTVGSSPAAMTVYQNVQGQEWFDSVMEGKGMYVWGNSEFSQGKPRITCARIINDKELIEPLGILVIYLNPDYMDQLISENGSEEDHFFCLDMNRKQLIMPSDGDAELAEAVLGSIPADGLLTETSIKDGYLISTTYMEKMDWVLVNAVTVGFYRRTQMINLGIIFLVTILCLVLSFITYTRFANSITRPIGGMIESMERVEKENFKTRVPVYRQDEIGKLGASYNQLIERINVLVNDVLRERLHSQQAELENLQAQINPHFLYNTLDCINWKAIINEQDEISDMVTALSSMFRFSLSGNDKLVTLREELANVKDYLLIQHKRFGDGLKFSLDVPEECMEIRILKYILQPVVENSILHGVGETGIPGEVTIAAASRGREIELRVLDNGPGVDLKAIERLLEGIQSETGKKHRHGIYNVNQRLKLQYGETYGLQFSNRPEGGTCVQILIPREEGKDV